MGEEGVIGGWQIHGRGGVSWPSVQGARGCLAAAEVAWNTAPNAMPRVADHSNLNKGFRRLYELLDARVGSIRRLKPEQWNSEMRESECK